MNSAILRGGPSFGDLYRINHQSWVAARVLLVNNLPKGLMAAVWSGLLVMAGALLRAIQRALCEAARASSLSTS